VKCGDEKVYVGTAASPVRRAQPGGRVCGAAGISRARVPSADAQGRSAPHSQGRSHPKTIQALLLGLAVFLFAGAGDPATRFTQLGHQLMCICGCNQILLECNHVGCPSSDGMRNELMSQVMRGDSDSLVSQAFVQKYGPTVLAAPTTSGFNRTAWIVPFVMLFLGLSVAVLVIRAWKNRPAPAIADGLHPLRGAELEQFRDQANKETEL
jgi:cytochrome c-type biogenesis protein CcmH